MSLPNNKYSGHVTIFIAQIPHVNNISNSHLLSIISLDEVSMKVVTRRYNKSKDQEGTRNLS